MMHTYPKSWYISLSVHDEMLHLEAALSFSQTLKLASYNILLHSLPWSMIYASGPEGRLILRSFIVDSWSKPVIPCHITLNQALLLPYALSARYPAKALDGRFAKFKMRKSWLQHCHDAELSISWTPQMWIYRRRSFRRWKVAGMW